MLVIISLAFFANCSTTRGISKESLSGEWKTVKENKSKNIPDWTIYSRKVPGSKFKEFKIVGTINVTPDTAIKALREKTENSKKYIKEKEGFVQVLSSTEDEMLVYSVYNMPFPFKDRAMCERFLFLSDKETGVQKITWEQDWEKAPPTEKHIIRMPIATGSWEFTPIRSGKSTATYIVHAAPGGNIPFWLVNATVSKGLPAELRNIEEIARQL